MALRPLKAIIDLGAIEHNLRVVRTFAKSSRVAAVVKADAYGHGARHVAWALTSADYLAVASIEEAHVLRDAGARQPILLLEGVFEAQEIGDCIARRFEIAVHCDEQIAILEAQGGTGRIGAWLKVDTGMSRLGFSLEMAVHAYHRMLEIPTISQPIKLMSHLASAEDSASQQTAHQLQSLLSVHGRTGGPTSLANSAGTLLHPSTHLDIVRPGIMLYGQSPVPGCVGQEHGLKPAMTLVSSVIAIRELSEGDTVGYGASWTAKRPSRLATLAVGYADGYPRSAPAGTQVLVGGLPASVAGRVSMDMIGVDITELPNVQIGDTAELWGPSVPIESLANAAGTIGYEIVAKLNRRVPRDYV